MYYCFSDPRPLGTENVNSCALWDRFNMTLMESYGGTHTQTKAPCVVYGDHIPQCTGVFDMAPVTGETGQGTQELSGIGMKARGVV